MIKLWDYFMRRKPLLVFTVVVFAASGFLSYKFLNLSIAAPMPPEYISIDNWGNTEVEIPPTGGLSPWIAVMQPAEIVALVRNESQTAPESPARTETEPQTTTEPEMQTSSDSDMPGQQIAHEDLDNLEQPTLPDSVVMEVLPPNEQMSDEVFSSTIDALEQATQPAAPDNTGDVTTNPTASRHLDISTMIMLIVVLGWSGYLLYWHFRR